MERMTAPASAKAELHALIETLSLDQAQDFLDYLNLQLDPDELTPEEEEAVRKAMEEFEHGETISGADLERELGIEVSA